MDRTDEVLQSCRDAAILQILTDMIDGYLKETSSSLMATDKVQDWLLDMRSTITS